MLLGDFDFIEFRLFTEILVIFPKGGARFTTPLYNFTCKNFDLTRQIVGAAELNEEGVLTFPLIASAKLGERIVHPANFSD